MTEFAARILTALTEADMPVTEHQAAQLAAFGEHLVAQNEKMNLTALTAQGDITEKHFIDSLVLLLYYKVPADAALADVGTGPGFPGIPLKIIRPDLQLTLIDSSRRRISFLQDACGLLDIKADCHHMRAEDAGRSDAMRGAFDAVTARALAPMPVLAEYCLPLVKTGGVFLALKGPGGRQEAQEGAVAMEKLGGRLCDLQTYRLPGGEQRSLLVVEKVTDTPPQYPRTAAAIRKRPLSR